MRRGENSPFKTAAEVTSLCTYAYSFGGLSVNVARLATMFTWRRGSPPESQFRSHAESTLTAATWLDSRTCSSATDWGSCTMSRSISASTCFPRSRTRFRMPLGTRRGVTGAGIWAAACCTIAVVSSLHAARQDHGSGSARLVCQQVARARLVTQRTRDADRDLRTLPNWKRHHQS